MDGNNSTKTVTVRPLSVEVKPWPFSEIDLIWTFRNIQNILTVL